MATVEIPLQVLPASEQRLKLDDEFFTLTTRWNSRAQAWCLDLADSDGALLVGGVRIVVGLSLLQRYGRRGAMPRGILMALDTANTGLAPAYEDLGTRVRLFYVEAADVAEALAE